MAKGTSFFAGCIETEAKAPWYSVEGGGDRELGAANFWGYDAYNA